MKKCKFLPIYKRDLSKTQQIRRWKQHFPLNHAKFLFPIPSDNFHIVHFQNSHSGLQCTRMSKELERETNTKQTKLTNSTIIMYSLLLKVGLWWVYAAIRLVLVNKEVLALADRGPPLSPAQTLDSSESDNPIQFGRRRPNPVWAEQEQNQLFTFSRSGYSIYHVPKHIGYQLSKANEKQDCVKYKNQGGLATFWSLRLDLDWN